MMQREWQSQAHDILHGDGEKSQQEKAPPYNLVTPRSCCPACDAPITAWQNIPLVSYALLKGRCASCGTAIPARYPLIELICGALSAILAWRFGFSTECLAALVLCWSLLALAVIDLDHQLLPDSITLPLLWAGLVFSLFSAPVADIDLFPDPRSSIIGAVAGYLSLWSIYHLFRLITGKEGMGYGDFKLFGALGAWLGWQMLPLIILMSAAVGAVVGIAMILFGGHQRQVPIPFGPYLAAAGVVALLWGPQLMSAYLKASGL